SRKAAEELRESIAARLDGSAGLVPAMTFHAFCYALVREFADPEQFARPPTLLTAPERDAVNAELLAGHEVDSWPLALRQALRTHGFAGEVQSFMAQLAARGLDAEDLRELAAARQRADWARLAD